MMQFTNECAKWFTVTLDREVVGHRVVHFLQWLAHMRAVPGAQLRPWGAGVGGLAVKTLPLADV